MVRARSVNAPHPVATTPVARRRPAAIRVAIAAALVVGVSILRPWGNSTAPAPRPEAGQASPMTAGAGDIAAATASPAPSLASDQIACSAAAWQLVSLDHLGTWTVRSWIPAEAVRADGPLDPSIRPVTLESPEVLAIGACSPATADGAGSGLPGGPAQLVGAWRIDAGRATPVSLAMRRDELIPGVATLYSPVGARHKPTDVPAAWPAGEFVLEVAPVGLADASTGRDPQGAGEPAGGRVAGWFVGLVVRGHG